MNWQRKYRWARTWPGETGLDGKLHEDYVGFDGEAYIGRIYLDTQTLKKDQWRWAGGMPKGSRSIMLPNSGWLPTAGEAAKQVEDYWNGMLRKRDEERASLANHVEEYKGYRVAVYSPNNHHAVVTAPGNTAMIDFGERQPRATAVEGYEICLGRARALIDEVVDDTRE